VRVPGEGAQLSADAETLLETVTAKWIAWDLGPATIKSYTKWSRRLLAWLDSRGIAPTQIQTEHLEAWAQRWYRHESNTKAALRCAVNALLKAAGEAGRMEPPPPLRRLGARTLRQPDVPEAADVKKLLREAECQRRTGGVNGALRWTLLMVFCHTGLRASEVARLERRKCRVEKTGRVLSIRVKSKWGHDEEVQVNASLAAALRDWFVLRDRLVRNSAERKRARKTEGWALSDYIFPSRNGRGPLSYIQVYKHIQHLAALARIRIHPHSLRHYFATVLLDHGVPVHDVQALMRHRNVSSLNPYLHSNVERQRRAVEEIATMIGRTGG
jgi:site-specific recombinase XerD